MHDYTFFYSPYVSQLLETLLPLLLVLGLWTIATKGYALWQAARSGQKEWFIALLIINTFGILEIVYLNSFRRSPSQSVPPAVSSSSQA